ncbi:hypothetical protein OU798_22950 [Prolixibacteraceae bacterium Z1-6]|uniref:Lipocalin-like domain-containing protein n=1 Tax=Draconibacterium aestuarii TaxID=2998507 RepID=A0A9X3J952_9BACT|nr:hypothetical protein [Prolixibacteraceae bacterium Z1-6]
MRPKLFKLSVITLLLLFAGVGCENDEPQETDPAQIILGKWELIEMGNYPNMEQVETPSGYKEYLPDSVLREYNYETSSFYYKTYWIDSLLHEGVYRSDGYLVATRYRYNFIRMNNKVELELHNAAGIYNNFIYQRIK